MNKRISKVFSLFLVLCLLCNINVSAKDIPTEGRPSISYGSSNSVTTRTYSGPFALGVWSLRSEGQKFSNWDSDTYYCYANGSNNSFTLTTTSSFEVTGETGLGFLKIAEAKVGAAYGTTWSRETQVSYDAQAGYKYTLWAANVKSVFNYEYNAGLTTVYKSSCTGKGGSVKWFFREKM